MSERMSEHAGFFGVAEAFPDRAALVDPRDDPVTYGELWARMNQARAVSPRSASGPATRSPS